MTARWHCPTCRTSGDLARALIAAPGHRDTCSAIPHVTDGDLVSVDTEDTEDSGRVLIVCRDDGSELTLAWHPDHPERLYWADEPPDGPTETGGADVPGDVLRRLMR